MPKRGYPFRPSLFRGKRFRGSARRAPWTVRNMRSRRGPRGTGFTSRDKDVTTTYRRKAMPRFKRKRWVSFVRKVAAARATTAGLRTAAREHSFSVTTSGMRQNFSFLSMYSMGGGTATGSAAFPAAGHDYNSDMIAIFQNEDTNIYGKKYMFQSCHMAADFSNNSPTQAVVVRIYSLVARRDKSTGGILGLNPRNVFETGYTQMDVAGGVLATRIDPWHMYATPFNNSIFCSSYKITQVKRLQIEPNETHNFEYRDPKNHVIQGADAMNYGAKRGVTKYWFFTVQGSPGIDGLVPTATVDVYVRRSYNYYMMENNAAATVAL